MTQELVSAKQAYEWVKTGHWPLREFLVWLHQVVEATRDTEEKE